MATRLPRPLTRRRTELEAEREALVERLPVIDEELRALDYALRVMSPAYIPSKKTLQRRKASRLVRGAVSEGCLQYLRRDREATSPAIAAEIARVNRVSFRSKAEEQDFASTVTMSLRRLEKSGVVESRGRDEISRALRWRLKLDPAGRLDVTAQEKYAPT